MNQCYSNFYTVLYVSLHLCLHAQFDKCDNYYAKLRAHSTNNTPEIISDAGDVESVTAVTSNSIEVTLKKYGEEISDKTKIPPWALVAILIGT